MIDKKIVIVGSGIIGLMTAFFLSSKVKSVIVLESSSKVGSEASWAGGGIISPLSPWSSPNEVNSLIAYSQVLYPQLIKEIKLLSNLDPELYMTGIYWLDISEQDKSDAFEWAEKNNYSLVNVSRAEIRNNISCLDNRFSDAIYMKSGYSIRNPNLIKSLELFLEKKNNVKIYRKHTVGTILRLGNKIIGVNTDKEKILCDETVLAAGAWTAGLIHQLHLYPPMEPIKGQMILYRSNRNILPSVLISNGYYAIPRKDGHILIGSTLEKDSFNKKTTESALKDLKKYASTLIPILRKSEPVGHWAGIRPGSPKGIPFIGELVGFEGLWINCGHFRNGLAMAPASCQLITDLILENNPHTDPNPYSTDCFLV